MLLIRSVAVFGLLLLGGQSAIAGLCGVSLVQLLSNDRVQPDMLLHGEPSRNGDLLSHGLRHRVGTRTLHGKANCLRNRM